MGGGGGGVVGVGGGRGRRRARRPQRCGASGRGAAQQARASHGREVPKRAGRKPRSPPAQHPCAERPPLLQPRGRQPGAWLPHLLPAHLSPYCGTGSIEAKKPVGASRLRRPAMVLAPCALTRISTRACRAGAGPRGRGRQGCRHDCSGGLAGWRLAAYGTWAKPLRRDHRPGAAGPALVLASGHRTHQQQHGWVVGRVGDALQAAGRRRWRLDLHFAC